MENFQIKETSGQWLFFIVSSKISLKAAVLLYNGNNITFVRLVQAVHMKGTHERLQVFLPKIRYYEHRWITYDDLKVLAMMTVHTKFYCF
jgi:hypothetical protein